MNYIILTKKVYQKFPFLKLYFFSILLGTFGNDVFQCAGGEFFDYFNGTWQNNIVFMGSPSITAPPNNTYDLTDLITTYNHTNEINLTEHYFHGPAGRNKFIVILMKNDVKFNNLML